MKNKLHLRPYLRFVSAPSADAGGESSDAQDAPVADGAAEKAQETDWAAEARKWKELSRKNEARMKENAEKARLYDEAQEKDKSELQKAQEAAAKAEARAAALEAKVLRTQVAAAKGVDADLLSGTSQEELEASADRLVRGGLRRPRRVRPRLTRAFVVMKSGPLSSSLGRTSRRCPPQKSSRPVRTGS